MAARLLEYSATADVCAHCNVVRCGVVNGTSKGTSHARMLKLGRDDWLGDGNFTHTRLLLKQKRRSCRIHVRAGIEELALDQVLVSAVTASTLAQLVKPFAAGLIGKGFNWKLIYKSGGMPSSHSAAVTAAATALAYERGLSDGVFGLSVIVACIVMYDAQGVRNAVGKQAKVINTMVVSYIPQPQPQPQPQVEQSLPVEIGAELTQDPAEMVRAVLDKNSSSKAMLNAPSLVILDGKSPSASKSYSETAADFYNGAYTRSRGFFRISSANASHAGGRSGHPRAWKAGWMAPSATERINRSYQN